MKNKNLGGLIIELRKNGKSVNEISKTLNCAKGTVSYHINLNGLGGIIKPFKYNSISLSNDEFINLLDINLINKIKSWKISGLSYKEIYNNSELSYDKIKRICRILKINKYFPKKTNNILIGKIKKTYDEHKSIRKTAQILKISRELVRQHIIITKLSPSEKKRNNVNAVNKHRHEIKKALVKYKGGKCEKCGYNKCIAALTFHHKNPKEKEFTIGGRNYAWDRMVREVNKCILVCHNCHAEIHNKKII